MKDMASDLRSPAKYLCKSLLMGVLIVFFASCKEKLIEPPENIIPQAEMTEILYDLALINGARTTNPTLLDNYNIKTMPYIYEKYDIDSLRFVTSDQYYASVPAVYQQMYQKISDRLQQEIKKIDEKRAQKNDSARARNKRVRDSLIQNAPTITPSPSKK